MEKNYYEILEVDKKASPEIIKKAYNTLAKKYHPDLQSDDLKSIYEEKFKLINEAYETLSIPEKREIYDSSLLQNTISKEDYDAIYIENQQLRNIIQELQNSIVQNNYESRNISYDTQQENLKNINNEKYYSYDNYEPNFESNQNNNIYENKFKNTIKNVISIILTIIILFLLWKIPFIRKIIEENILFDTTFFNK